MLKEIKYDKTILEAIEGRYNVRAKKFAETTDDIVRAKADGWMAGAEFVLARLGIDFDNDENGWIQIKL